MSFARDYKLNNEQVEYRKPTYFTPQEGLHIIRILNDTAWDTFQYRLGQSSIIASEDATPIRDRNLMVKSRNPDNYWNDADYIKGSNRFFVNVWVKSEVKVHPESLERVTKDVSGNFPMTSQSGRIIPANAELTKENFVAIFNNGRRLFIEQLQEYWNQFNDPSHPKYNVSHPLTGKNLNEFDIELRVIGRGIHKSIIASPIITNVEPVPQDILDQKFALPDDLLRFTDAEIEQMLNGVSSRDVLKARGSNRPKREEKVITEEDKGKAVDALKALGF